jgi:subtilisin family serine protease
MAKLEPELRTLLLQNDASTDKPIYISLKFTGDVATLASAPFTLGSAVGNIAYGRTNLAGLEVLSKHPQVELVRKQRRKSFALDNSVPNVKANLVWSRSGDDFKGYTGRGVIIGFVDSGIDITHQVFRKAGGASRIINIWDQTLGTPQTPPQGGETVPGPIVVPTADEEGNVTPRTFPLGYGVEYNHKQINNTLQFLDGAIDKPEILVRHVDEKGHGTHVAGIAAGDGSQSGNCESAYHYVGVAPEADIIMVRLWGQSEAGIKPNTDSNYMVDAIADIMNRARGISPTQPVVINLSVWEFTEEMDGSSSDCETVDILLRGNSEGTAIVFCAGNAGASSYHAEASVPPGQPAPPFELPFMIAKNDKEYREIGVKYSGTNLRAKLISPVGIVPGPDDWVSYEDPNVINTTANGPGGSVTLSNDVNGIFVQINPPNGGNNVAGGDLTPWKLVLQDAGSTTTPFHAFCLRGSLGRRPTFTRYASVRSTLSSDASGKESISVGNYRLGNPLKLDAMSGRGPTLDVPSRTKPDVCAPGVGIFSAAVVKERSACARCCCDCCDDAFYRPDRGTSMSAPHVSGLIALMLHKNPTLTHKKIKDLLIQNANADSLGDDPFENVGWGAGRIDAEKTVGAGIEFPFPTKNKPIERKVPALPLAALHASLLETKSGPKLERLLKSHGNEVWTLIQKNRKVATIWHRCRGPIWVRFALKAAHEPERPVPFEADGLPLTEALPRFARALKQFGSQALRHDVERWESAFARLRDGMSVKDIIETVGNHSAAESISAAPA